MTTALWTYEQVANLNAYQRAGVMHPFTCGNEHDGERDLVATVRGWICTCCDYTQDWAHDFMLDGSAVAAGQQQRQRMERNRTMDFGQALHHLRNGERVTRAGWNGKGQALELQRPDENSKMTLPYIFIHTVQGDRVPWLASQTDMLANDWETMQ